MCSLSKMASETYGGTPACALFLIMLFSPLPVYKKYRLQTNKLSGKQLWSAICFKIMTRYTCGFFPRILAIIPATQYTCVLFPSIWPFSYKRAYICAQKIPYICVTSVWIKHGRYGRINFEQDLLLIHCPHSSGGCWLPDNGFVGICGLSLERLCTLFHKCWPKQRSIQLEN